MYGNDLAMPLAIVGALIFLILIGRESIIKLIFNLVRGTLYLIIAVIIGYVLKHYWRDVIFHARRMWEDINQIIG